MSMMDKSSMKSKGKSTSMGMKMMGKYEHENVDDLYGRGQRLDVRYLAV